jgi:hypothetical protein
MEHTLTLRLTNTPARAEIARLAVVALAVRSGLPALAADRAGAAVASVVRVADADELAISAELNGSLASLTLTGGDETWCREAAAALSPLGATAHGDRLLIRLQRTPLRSV